MEEHISIIINLCNFPNFIFFESNGIILSGHKEIISEQKNVALEDKILNNIIEEEDSDLYYHPLNMNLLA